YPVHSSFKVPPNTLTYPLSLHDALPISLDHTAGKTNRGHRERVAEILHLVKKRRGRSQECRERCDNGPEIGHVMPVDSEHHGGRSEEHTSELQSQSNLVCRLLLEKKKSD